MFGDFMRELMRPEPVPADPVSPAGDWKTGIVYEVDEETYFDFLEILPPRWVWASAFCFAEGCDPFVLFWKLRNRFFARRLTEDETRTFCVMTQASRE